MFDRFKPKKNKSNESEARVFKFPEVSGGFSQKIRGKYGFGNREFGVFLPINPKIKKVISDSAKFVEEFLPIGSNVSVVSTVNKDELLGGTRVHRNRKMNFLIEINDGAISKLAKASADEKFSDLESNGEKKRLHENDYFEVVSSQTFIHEATVHAASAAGARSRKKEVPGEAEEHDAMFAKDSDEKPNLYLRATRAALVADNGNRRRQIRAEDWGRDVIHHVKNSTSISDEEKEKAKQWVIERKRSMRDAFSRERSESHAWHKI